MANQFTNYGGMYRFYTTFVRSCKPLLIFLSSEKHIAISLRNTGQDKDAGIHIVFHSLTIKRYPLEREKISLVSNFLH